jgi:hypothetical protein
MLTKPPHALWLAGWVLLVSVVFASGCSRPGPLSPDQKVATRQVGELIPRGTTEARARRVLGDRGFTLSRLSSDHATNHLLIATLTKRDLMWQVGLIVIDARIAATSVTVSDFSAVAK